MAFLLNSLSRVIKLARDRTGEMSVTGLYCRELASRGPYCQDKRDLNISHGWALARSLRTNDSKERFYNTRQLILKHKNEASRNKIIQIQ